MKQKLIQKQTTQQEIKEKTKQLIKNITIFKVVENKFKQTSIKLCEDLIDLHRIENPDYTFCNLLQEKELQNYSDVLETYVPYDVSPLVTDMYIKGKLSNTDLMVLANTDKEFKEPERQKKIVEGIIKKEIKSRKMIGATKNEIREMIGEEMYYDDDEFIYLHIHGNIVNAKNNILKNKKYFNSKKRKKLLIKNFNLLKNSIRFGLKIKLR